MRASRAWVVCLDSRGGIHSFATDGDAFSHDTFEFPAEEKGRLVCTRDPLLYLVHRLGSSSTSRFVVFTSGHRARPGGHPRRVAAIGIFRTLMKTHTHKNPTSNKKAT